MNSPPLEKPLDLQEYIGVLRTRKWTIVVVVFLSILVALGMSLRQTPLYRSNAQVLVKTIESDRAPSTRGPNMQTEAAIASSEQVASIVQENLDTSKSIASLLGSLNVNPLAGTEVLAFRYTSPDPNFARDAAEAFADGYLENRRTAIEESIQSSQEDIELQLQTALTQLEDVTEQLDETGPGDEAVRTSLETQRTALVARIGLLQQRLADTQPDTSLGLAVGQVIQPARLPSSPASPNHPVNLVLGAIVGLLLGIATAFVRERLEDRFRGRTNVEEVLAAPVLATVPRFKQAGRADGLVGPSQIQILSHPRGVASEAYRTLRTNIEYITGQRGVSSVVVTSSGAAEGKTETASNLAIALAQSGKRVILVSADLRRPTLEDRFGVPNERGLSTWLTGEEDDLWSLLADPGIPRLRLLPSGPVPHNPAELLSSTRMRRLIGLLNGNSDYAIFDSTPTLTLADALIVASRVDASILVIDPSGARKSAVLHAKQELERTGAQVVGAVLNAFDPSTAHYDYYYPAYYGYHGKTKPVATTTEPSAKRAGQPRKRRILSRFGR